MRNKLLAALSAIAVVAGVGYAYGAGNWSTLPVVGGTSFCASTSSGVVNPSSQGPYGVVPGSTQGTGQGICAQTVPAGPSVQTGNEMVPADLYTSTGNTPTNTALIPTSVIGSKNTHANYLQGGDFTTNLWQRGTTPLSAASPTTSTMSADRWFAISASNAMTVSKQTPSSSAADYLGNLGFYSWMRVARPSGTPSGTSCVGQILDQKASADLIGKNAVLTFYGYAPTTFSASNSAITVSIAYYTAADSTTGGTNTATFGLSASGQGGGITGYTAATAGTVNGTSGALASGVETINLTTTPTLYGVYAPIPSANASGTAVTGVGVSICATPTATTTVSTDYFELTAVQLQAMPSTVTPTMPAGVVSYTGFERVLPGDEQRRELSYSYVLTDGAITQRYAMGEMVSSTGAQIVLQFPEAMRETPTTTVGTATSFAVTSSNGSSLNCSTLAAIASSNTSDTAGLLCTSTSMIAGDAAQFIGANTGGIVTLSAEP